MRNGIHFLVTLGLEVAACQQPARFRTFESEHTRFRIDTVASDLKIPFALDWLPDGKGIFTERGKAEEWMSLLDPTTGVIEAVKNLPTIYAVQHVGALDVLVSPTFNSDRLLYFSYSITSPDTDSVSTLAVDRARLTDGILTDRERLFVALPYFNSDNHYGNRLAVKGGFLFITMGERYYARDSAQTLTNHFGKVLRLNTDGSVPADNPFVQTKNSLPEIWSLGHRNPQGMALHPLSGELWLHEHGPQGGDELNLLKKGANYGWPLITYGEEYGGGKIGDGLTEMDGMEQPLYYWVPSIAPSDMFFYTGEAFPDWKGSLFIGSMALQHLNRLTLAETAITHEERLLEEQRWRVRVASQGPDGYIYIGTDNGLLLRLRPTQ